MTDTIGVFRRVLLEAMALRRVHRAPAARDDSCGATDCCNVDVVAKTKTLEERLWGAAVLKMSFRLRGDEGSAAFKSIYPGVLRDLDVEDAAVEAFIQANQARVEKAARGSGA